MKSLSLRATPQPLQGLTPKRIQVLDPTQLKTFIFETGKPDLFGIIVFRYSIVHIGSIVCFEAIRNQGRRITRKKYVIFQIAPLGQT